jgi:tripartite-type tricarboxylate transporter receptor subunit TctC
MTNLPRRGLLALAAGLPFAAARAEAPAWPVRPVRLICSASPGAGIDLLARLLGQGLARRLGQPFPVENRAGAGMLLAGEAHAQARPGDAVLLAPTGIASTVPFTQPGRLPYDPEADLVPVGLVASEYLCIAVPGGAPARSLAELVAAARAQPGELAWYSVPGLMELAWRAFLQEARLDMPYVAYRGSPAAVLDLAAGRFQAAILPLTPALGAIRAGDLRALAITGSARAPALPAVPTVEEAGFPALRYDSLTGLFGWRGMAEEVRDRLAAAVEAVLRETPQDDRLAAAGMTVQPGSPAGLAAVIAAQRLRVQAAVRAMGAAAQP